ncbi:MAG: YgfZ/GcvT domain-containing protein [Acidimicrobiia bacterium]
MPLPTRVRVSGPDAVSFLQGQLSQDVADLGVGSASWSFLLEPQGKVVAFLRVERTADDALELATDAPPELVMERLERFKLRVKATIETVAAEPVAAADEEARIAAGLPGHADVSGRIPGETGLVPVAVSFTKGCYTGQELVARVDSRGNNVPRLLRRVEAQAPVHAGDSVVVEGQVRGEITSAAGAAAIASVHRSVEVPADALVRSGSHEVMARLLAVPPVV